MANRLVDNLPAQGRSTANFAALTPGGIVIDGNSTNLAIGGGRVRNQGYMLDGGTLQNVRIGMGQADLDPPADEIKEFKVISNSYSAEYGGSGSGIVVRSSQSGTNQFHGSAYDSFPQRQAQRCLLGRYHQRPAAPEPVRRNPGRSLSLEPDFLFFQLPGRPVARQQHPDLDRAHRSGTPRQLQPDNHRAGVLIPF